MKKANKRIEGKDYKRRRYDPRGGETGRVHREKNDTYQIAFRCTIIEGGVFIQVLNFVRKCLKLFPKQFF